MEAQELIKVICSKTNFQVIEHTITPSRLRLVGRVVPPMDSWWIVVDRILTAEKQGMPWSVDFSRHYFKPEDKIRFAWRLILQAPDVAQHFQVIANLIMSAPKAQAAPVDEMPLAGSHVDRNQPRNGRGAQGVFNPVVGAMAAAARFRGGR